MPREKQATILLVEAGLPAPSDGRLLLEQRGYSVITAGSGAEALSALAGHEGIDIVLMDIDLGKGIDGVEAASRMLLCRELPIVFISSHLGQEIVDRIGGITSYGYVDKNSGITVLDASIRTALRLFKSRQEGMGAGFRPIDGSLSRLLIEKSLVGIYIIQHGRMAYVNPRFERIFGYPPREIAGLAIGDLIHPDDVEAVMRNYGERMEGREGNDSVAYRGLKKDGTIISIEVYSALTDFNGGKAVMGTLLDVTERTRAEEKRRDSEKRLSDIILSAADWIWEVNERGVYTHCSEKGAELLGVPQESIIGKTPFDFMRPDEAKRVGELFSAIVAAKAPIQDLENWNIGRNGDLICLLTNGVPILDKEGNLRGYRGVDKDITERKLKEAELQNERKRFARLVTNIPNGIYQMHSKPDGSYKFDYASPRMAEMLNTTVESMLADPSVVIGLIHPEDREDFTRLNEESTRSRGKFDWEGRALVGGQTIWIRIASIPEVIENGEILWNGIVADITDRKRVEAALSLERNLLGELMNNSSDHIYFKDLESRFIRASRAQARYFGLDEPSLMVGKTDVDFFTEDDAVESRADEEAILKSGLPIDKEERKAVLNRPPEWVHTVKLPMKNGAGEIIGTFGISRDISERKRIQEELRLSEAKYRSYVESSTDGIVVFTRAGKYRDVNKAMCEMTGFSREELLTMSIRDMIAEESLEAGMAGFREIEEKGATRTELIFRNKDGSLHWRSVDAIVLDEGLILASSKDITERKANEMRIENLLVEKDLILKEVHHRIKNNMNTMKSLVYLHRKSLDEPAAVDALKDVESRFNSMLVLYDRLYRSTTFTSISIRNYLPPLMDEVVCNFPNCDSVEMIYRVDDFVLESKTLQTLGIIVNELLTNIMKYAFVDGRRGVITVEAATEGERVHVSIHDNGVGMPENIDFNHSSGFGLMLIKELTKQLDGRIGIERGSGTRISLEFGAPGSGPPAA